jgi:AAA+ superfamily predicted ATPase
VALQQQDAAWRHAGMVFFLAAVRLAPAQTAALWLQWCMPTPAQIEALNALLDTRTPITLIETHDEPRVLALFTASAKSKGREPWTWSASSGLRVVQGLKLQLMDLPTGNNAKGEGDDTKELPAALAAVERLREPALVLFLDIHPFLSNPVITRRMKELALRCEARGLQLVFVGHDIKLPEELSPLASRFELEPMTLDRVKAVFNEELKRRRDSKQDATGSRATLDSLLRHMVGLPHASVRHLARLVLGDGEVNAADLARVLAVKHEVIGGAEVLQFEHHLPTLDDVAGMAALKRWLKLRREPFLSPQATGLPPPRGVLLLGVQGAGKSLAAKAIAASWQVPLFRMDFGALYDKWQGESERKLREALRVADAMQPCVLWMDEIEKGLAGGDGAGDGTGAGKRMLGTLLTWMAERRGSVFLAATANDIDSLPPELMRKGRFDEIFFVDLPSEPVRAGIFGIHLKKHGVAHDDAALAQLVAASAGFSGAEIEAAIVAARYEAHGSGQGAAAVAQVAAELAKTRPLSVTRAEAIEALRAWAGERTVGVE